MHNHMVEMCGSCLKQDVPLFDYMDDDMDENEQNYKHVKNSSIIRDLFREDFKEEFYNWKLCENCSILLKEAVSLKKGLLSSQLIYHSYLRIFNANNRRSNNQFSNLSVQLQDRINYETVEATECNTEDRCGKSEMQLDGGNFGIDVLEIKDIKIEIDETNYEEMNNFSCVQETIINIKIKPENETVVLSPMVEPEQHKVSMLSYEGSSGVPCLKVESEMDTVTDCNDDIQTKAANANCQNISFKCIVCNQKFARKLLLLAHLSSHSDAKPYKCDICGKMFSDKTDFNRHRIVHTGEKPYKCDLCEKAFALTQSYTKHRLTHTGEKPYNCDLCEKAFALKQSLTKHRWIHTGEKPYKCDLCAKAFRDKSAYNGHRQIHTDEKLYKCDLCGMTFSYKSACIRHKRRIHTGEQKGDVEIDT